MNVEEEMLDAVGEALRASMDRAVATGLQEALATQGLSGAQAGVRLIGMVFSKPKEIYAVGKRLTGRSAIAQ